MKKRMFAAGAALLTAFNLFCTPVQMTVSAQAEISEDSGILPTDPESIISRFGELSDFSVMKPEETDFLDFSSAAVPKNYLCYGFTKSEGSDYPYKIIGVESFSLMAEVSCKNITLEQVRAVAATTIDDAYIFSCGQDQFGGVSGLIRIAYSADAAAGFEELVTAFIAALQEKNADVYSAKTYIHTTSDWFAPSNSFYLTYFTYTSHIEEDRAIVAEYIEKNALPWQIINYGKGGPFYVDLIGAPASPEQQLEMARRLYHDLGFQMKYSCPEIVVPASFNTKVLIAPQYAKGDVNMDGQINLEDAMLVLQDYVEQIMYNDGILTEQQRQLGNVDNQVYIAKAPYIPLDGTVLEDVEILDDVLDARYILQYYVAVEVTHQIDNSISIEEFINQ